MVSEAAGGVSLGHALGRAGLYADEHNLVLSKDKKTSVQKLQGGLLARLP